MKMLKCLGLILLAFAFAACQGQKAETKVAAPTKTVKAGFIYIGPAGDFGWSYAHDQGRKYVEAKFPWLKTVVVDSVPENDSAKTLARLADQEKCDIIFATSFGYMDDTAKAAAQFPNTTFMHCSGFKTAPNLGTYFAELYQEYYLNGLMAGALSKTGKIGYVGAFPVAEVIRHINAFALGVKAVNPKATVDVRWINAWYGPDQAKEAAEALISSGVDTLAFTEDSPSVIEVAQKHTTAGKQIYSFAHYSPMLKFGPDTVVSGEMVNWGEMYAKTLQDFYDGKWKNDQLYWRAKEKGVYLGADEKTPINPKFVDELKAKKVKDPVLGDLSVYDLIQKRQAQFDTDPVGFDPFTGPIKDQSGKVQIKDGDIATVDFLTNMNFFVPNVVAKLSK